MAAAASLAAFAGPRLVRGAASSSYPVTLRDPFLKNTGMDDCWSAFRLLGAEGLELSVNPDMALPSMYHPTTKYALATADGIAAFKEAAQVNGARTLTFLMANRFDVRLDEEVAWMKKVVTACQCLGARTVRIDVAPHSKQMPREQFLALAIDACKQVSAIAADGGVRLGIENHGNTTNDPAFMQQLLDGVGADNLGLTLDTANFYWFGHPLDDLYGIYRKFAPRVFHTHCKSIKYPDDVKNTRRQMGWKYAQYACPIDEGDIDFARVVQILRDARYDGDLCVEDESLPHFPKEQQGEVLKREIAMLKKLA